MTNEAEVSMVQDVRVETANAVTTRAQKVKEASTHVPVFDQSRISVADFRNRQKHGASLQRVRKPTKQWFRVDGQRFFRHQQCDDAGYVRRQLVVPHSRRRQVMKAGHCCCNLSDSPWKQFPELRTLVPINRVKSKTIRVDEINDKFTV